MNKSLVLALITIAFMLGVGTGFYLTPEYAQMRQDKNSPMQELGKADKYLDLRYVNNMIAHHKAAIYLAEQALKNSDRTEIRSLAETVIKLDTDGIAKLYENKKNWYGDTKEVSIFEKVNLGDKDENFDLRFLNALIAHHDEAIMGAKEMLTKSSRGEVINLANEVIDFLSANSNQLKEWRKSWYGVQ